MWSLFRRSRPGAAATAVKIPAERFVVLQGEADGMPELRIINQALDGFGATGTFDWHLSIIIEMAEQNAAGLPTKEEQAALGQLGETIAKGLKSGGNAALLASNTWNGTRQLVYRVRDPEVANGFLQGIVAAPVPGRAMEYQMEEDPSWRFAEQYLQPGRTVS